MRVHTALGELYVEDEGQGPAVVLWHSYLHHGGMWRGQIAALRANHRVVNIDAPGHGRSSPLRGPSTMDDCAAAVEVVLDEMHIERTAFCGLSWGGMVAMAFALSRPHRTTALALLDTSCASEPLYQRMKYQALGVIFRKLGAVPLLLAQIEPLFFSDETLRGQRSLVEDWARTVAGMDPDSVWNALQCIVGRRDLRGELGAVRVPTLVMCGRDDRAQPIAQSEIIARSIPGSKLVVIDGAGHLSALERPREVNDVLVPFLRTHASEVATQASATAG